MLNNGTVSGDTLFGPLERYSQCWW